MVQQRRILTGANGMLRYNGQRISKCKNFSIEVNRDSLETTSCGEDDREFIYGLRGGQGSAVVLYDANDLATAALLNSILSNEEQSSQVEMTMDTTTLKGLGYDALLTNVGTPVAVGEVTACTIQFQVTGPFRGGF